MNIDEYIEASKELLDEASAIEERKRPSYTMGDEDVLRNFKRDADLAGISTLQNWYTHLIKQVAALGRWARSPDAEQSEPILSRLADLVNYAKLGNGLRKERGDK